MIDRQGHVTHIIIGDAQRILIPELEQIRETRLRGIRLIHTHLKKEPLSEEDLTDLTLLRLDWITAVTINENGLPAKFFSAHVDPDKPGGISIEPPMSAVNPKEKFTEIIADLEYRFDREGIKLKKNSNSPRAILVGVYAKNKRFSRSPQDSINELQELAVTAGIDVVDIIIQNRPAIDSITIAGTGKIKEISILAVMKQAEMIIFDMEISPAQATKISKLCDLKIIDRTQLILDIFARNAKSRDGKMQVELAQLRYLKGRLSEKDDNMSRLTGGIGGRGPGETKLEIGRRRVNDKITRLEKELSSMRHRRELNRMQREKSGIPVVSIVGYTNAGKSTLLNSLTNSTVIAEKRMFATLDPTTRRMRFPENREIILSDTVGFIHDLPPELKKAFQATLEELHDSSLLIHCIDAADKNREQKIEAVEKILNEMELADLPVLRVYNKSDLLNEEEKIKIGSIQNSILISSSKKENFDRLLETIETILFDTDKHNYQII